MNGHFTSHGQSDRLASDLSRRRFLGATSAMSCLGLVSAIAAAESAKKSPATTPDGRPSAPEEPLAEVWRRDRRLIAFRKRVLDFDPKRANTGWLDVLVAQGAARCAVKLQDEPLRRWAVAWADYHTALPIGTKRDSSLGLLDPGTPSKGIYLNSYCGDWGAPLALTPLHLQTQNPIYLEVIKRTADHVMAQSARAPDGTILHSAGLGVWVDTLYYTASVLASAYAATGDRRYADEAVRQCVLHAKHLRDEKTGLFYHDVNLKTGVRTSAFWARGNGWIIMALADTLTLVPRDTAGYDEVLSIYRSQVTGLLSFQHPAGLLRIVPEEPTSHLETSGTTMLLCGLVTGISAGLLPNSSIDPLRRGFSQVITWINAKGQLMGSQQPAGLGGWETHKLVATGESSYTTGAFLRLVADLGSTRMLEK